MTTTFSAIFEQGVLRPTEPVDLTEGSRVQVTVSEQIGKPATDDSRGRSPQGRQAPMTHEEMMADIDRIAALTRDGPIENVSENHDQYLYNDKERGAW
jgi:predicted DNA-binding antitoxin AbrB/MazE fold protein